MLIDGYDPAFNKAEDVDLYFRLSRQGRLANIPTLGLQYRHHIKSTNFQFRELQRGLLKRILERESGLARRRGAGGSTRGPPDLTPRPPACALCLRGALAHGSRLTAIRHALCGIIQARGDPECWRAFRYVLTARRPVFYSR